MRRRRHTPGIISGPAHTQEKPRDRQLTQLTKDELTQGTKLGSNLYTCPHMPRPGHVWACVLFRGACVLGSRVLEGGMCGACVLFGCLLLKSRKNFACGAHNPGGNPPDPPRSQNGHVYFEIPNPSTEAYYGCAPGIVS